MNDTAQRHAANGRPGVGSQAGARAHPLSLERITHRFGEFVAVDDVTLDIGGGELVALLGPSGCGKTTLLRIIAGFVRQTQGRVAVDGAAIDRLSPAQRNIGVVFQNYALFPHMSVAENVAYGLQAQRWPRERIAPKVQEMLALTQLEALKDRLPRQLSGGQQQRTAIARAMAVEPKILLLDEPFGALDKNLRLDMQIEVKRIQRQLGITTIMVTHDQEEALGMADRIAVLNRGRLEQLSPPAELYDRPRTLFVNSFVGATNLLPGRVAAAQGGRVTRVRLETGADIACDAQLPAGPAGVDAPVWLSVRPEQISLEEAGASAVEAEIVTVMLLGPAVVLEARLGDGTSLKISQPRGRRRDLGPGARVSVGLLDPASCSVFPRDQAAAPNE